MHCGTPYIYMHFVRRGKMVGFEKGSTYVQRGRKGWRGKGSYSGFD
jgi:hypothetical protein